MYTIKQLTDSLEAVWLETRALEVAKRRLEEARYLGDQARRYLDAGVTQFGRRLYGDGDAWTDWWVICLDPEEHADLLARCEAQGPEEDVLLAEDLDMLAGRVARGERYGGPGQVFTRRPFTHVGRFRVLVTQSGGWDI